MSTPTYTLTLELKTCSKQAQTIEKHLEITRVIYNTVLGELLKRKSQMERSKEFQKVWRQYRAVVRKEINGLVKKEKSLLKEEKKLLFKQIYEIQYKWGLTKYQSSKWSQAVRNHFENTLNNAIGYKAAHRAWSTFEKYLKREAKRVHFISKGEIRSLENSRNDEGIIYKDHKIKFGKQIYQTIISKDDIYALEACNDRVKYSRIVRRTIRGQKRYYVQLILEGVAPRKRSMESGKWKTEIGMGDVGIDIGTQTVACVSEEQVTLNELSPNTKDLSRKIRFIQRKIDRSRRNLNPSNYNDNGTIVKGPKVWVYSNRYNKLKSSLTELLRKEADKRKQAHRHLVNQLLPYGKNFYVETMHFKALQKRMKETKISEKTGRIQRKKRFGKTIATKAPALFIQLLKERVEGLGGSFQEINTHTFKASQYDHIGETYIKKKLSQRWHVFSNGDTVQRDLYSAFLLMNSNDSCTQTDQGKCDDRYDSFKIKHDVFWKKISEEGKSIVNSGF